MAFASPSERMSVAGTLNKSILLVVIALVTAALNWSFIYSNPGFGMTSTILAAIIGFGIAIYTVFQPQNSAISAPVYAAAEGIVLGGISAIYAAAYHGIVAVAVPLTICILMLMLGLYRAGVLRATPMFTRVIVISTCGIAVFYLFNLVMGLFGAGIHLQTLGPLGIGISLFICGIAALNFILDFDFIERGAEAGAPKYMEWYGAFSMCVTLFWLYLEILRLLSLLSDSRR
jgi:uncharacterized YccA/Bax inhibitor family protein